MSTLFRVVIRHHRTAIVSDRVLLAQKNFAITLVQIIEIVMSYEARGIKNKITYKQFFGRGKPAILLAIFAGFGGKSFSK